MTAARRQLPCPPPPLFFLLFLPFLFLHAAAATAAGAACALVATTPLQVFCAPGAAACAPACRSPSPWPARAACTQQRADWLQAAVLAAAAAGRGGGGAPTPVAVGAGAVWLAPQPVWAPLGPTTGLHVPSGVQLESACADGRETVLRAAVPAGGATLSSLVLVSEVTTGFNASLDLPPAHTVRVHNLALDGTCGGGGGGSSCIGAGVAAGLVSHDVQLDGLWINNTVGNAIDLGTYSSWTPARPADRLRRACNTTGFCAAKVLGFDAPAARPNRVAGNTIRRARFGGITVIGSNVWVVDNDIEVIEQTWTGPAQSFGITMGVSAGFVGSANVTVAGNRITGADYGVGSDGSFPLYTTVAMFQYYWPVIYARETPAFRARYPHGLPLDAHGNLAFADTDDYVTAHQVVSRGTKQKKERKIKKEK